jgi:hypothetical protein
VDLCSSGPRCGGTGGRHPAEDLDRGRRTCDPIYDQAKIALVDEIVRSGVPPANPFVGTGDGGSGSTTYYYYWLFGAAQLALITGASGWEADVAAT